MENDSKSKDCCGSLYCADDRVQLKKARNELDRVYSKLKAQEEKNERLEEYNRNLAIENEAMNMKLKYWEKPK